MISQKSYCLALDQGTFSSRAIVYDETGTALYSASRSIDLQRIDNQQVEQNADQLLSSVINVLEQVLSDQRPYRDKIISAGLATQRSSIVAWQPSNGKALSPVLSWQDTRAADWLCGFESEAQQIQSRTGLRLSAHYSVSKMQWLLQHNQNVQQAVLKQDCVITPIASYLLYHLNEDPLIHIDIANASRSLLCNIKQRDWDQQLLQLFSIPQELIARCRPTNYRYGTIKNTTIAITAVNGDQTAALYSNGEPSSEALRVNLGTGAFVLTPVTKQVLDAPAFIGSGLLAGISSSSQSTARYYIEGTVNGAGSALQWLQQNYPVLNVEEMLQSTLRSDGQQAVFINAVGNMGSPIWRSDIKAHFIDSQAMHNEVRQAVTAILESIVFLLVINIQQMQQIKSGLKKIEISGGLSNLDYVCQTLANLSEIHVERSLDTEATARGIAWLSRPNKEHWKTGQIDRSWQPQIDDALQRRYRQFCQYLQDQYAIDLPN